MRTRNSGSARIRVRADWMPFSNVPCFRPASKKASSGLDILFRHGPPIRAAGKRRENFDRTIPLVGTVPCTRAAHENFAPARRISRSRRIVRTANRNRPMIVDFHLYSWLYVSNRRRPSESVEGHLLARVHHR